MAEAIRLGLVGCGFMGVRHLRGYKELEENDMRTVQLEAVCDIDRERAGSAAEIAYTSLGRRPRVYTDLDEMIGAEKDLDGVDIVTVPKTHHVLACRALEAGLHVLVEKPMGLTVRACNLVVQAARDYRRVLSVAENYRRDPLNRVVKALIQSGVIGRPYMVFHHSAGGGDELVISAWRHMRNESGILVDHGVHFADVLRYFLGEVEEVYGRMALFERRRFRRERRTGEAVVVEAVEPTAEDVCMALLRFSSGVLGDYVLSHASHGEGLWQRVIYGSRGSVHAPPDRTGRPIGLKVEDETPPEDILRRLALEAVDEPTSRLFPGVEGEYHLTFPEIDRKLIGIEVYEFSQAVLHGVRPEVDGVEGLRDVALVYAMLESAWLGEPVKAREVEEGSVRGYQLGIDKSLGLD